MPNEKELTHISKFLSLVLRHQPETIGIHLDPQGWVAVSELLEKSAQHGMAIDRPTLNTIVQTNSKKRFAFNEAGDMIRASQGHSVVVELGYSSKQPPDILFHGTGENSVASILATGLEKRERQHVHLSSDVETAVKVGQRHGKPMVLKIRAAQMYHDQFSFYLSDNGVWLTDHVPVKYIEL
ncbi:MAG: RNA 2'-phosphotransferase [Cyclobacteriaceae bacterium]|nr:RNA 2'-phosphotransferase [Cyclobacteriaceae bacterium]